MITLNISDLAIYDLKENLHRLSMYWYATHHDIAKRAQELYYKIDEPFSVGKKPTLKKEEIEEILDILMKWMHVQNESGKFGIALVIHEINDCIGT